MSRLAASCAMATAAAGVLTYSTAFVLAPFSATSQPQMMLRGSSAAPQGTAGQGCVSMVTLSAAAVAMAVGGGVQRRRNAKTACAAVGEVKELPGGFAGGLVGSQYHGFGSYEWDPLELSARWPEHLAWYRESELKHGRVAMLAFLGLTVPDAVRLPLDILQDSSLDLVNAHNKLITGLGQGPMWWLLLFTGVVESIRFKQVGLGFENLTLQNAGDLDFGKAFLPKTEEGVTSIKIKELKNGRLAMLAVSGILTQSVLWESHHFPFVPLS